jgi:hypothetical protein
MTYSPKSIIYIFFLLISVDFGGDSILRAFAINANLIDTIAKYLISFVAFILLASFGFKLPRRLPLLLPFLIFLGVILIGFLNGLLSNNIVNVLNETIPFFFITLFLVFSAIKNPFSVLEIESFLKIFVYIVSFKVLIYLVASYLVYDLFSWKILLKQSPFLLIPLSVYLSKVSIKIKSDRVYGLLLLLFICIVFAQARMLMLASIVIFMVYFLNRRVARGLFVAGSITASLGIYMLITGIEITDFSKSLYGGGVFEKGLDYRIVQLEIIMNRLIDNPFLGVGFGYYTPGYLTYGELAKPFLLELDILNFISKIGLIVTFFYGVAYILLFRLIKKIADDGVRLLAKSLFVSLVGLLIYSLGQTLHQSYLYWIVLAFVYGFVVSHLKAQNKFIEEDKKSER